MLDQFAETQLLVTSVGCFPHQEKEGTPAVSVVVVPHGSMVEQAVQNTIIAVFLQKVACTVSLIERSNKVEFALEMKFLVMVLFIQCISSSSPVFPSVTTKT